MLSKLADFLIQNAEDRIKEKQRKLCSTLVRKIKADTLLTILRMEYPQLIADIRYEGMGLLQQEIEKNLQEKFFDYVATNNIKDDDYYGARVVMSGAELKLYLCEVNLKNCAKEQKK
jgi:hypothetical protein